MIDFLFAVVIMWILLAIFSLLKYFLLGINIEETANDLENMDPLANRILTLLMYALIMFLLETATKGRSLGKLITGTKVVKVDDSDLTVIDLLKRNFMRAVPFDQFTFIGSKGWHDNFSNTAVVRLKNFKNAKSLEEEMEKLGTKENI